MNDETLSTLLQQALEPSPARVSAIQARLNAAQAREEALLWSNFTRIMLQAGRSVGDLTVSALTPLTLTGATIRTVTA